MTDGDKNTSIRDDDDEESQVYVSHGKVKIHDQNNSVEEKNKRGALIRFMGGVRLCHKYVLSVIHCQGSNASCHLCEYGRS